jgi:hydrogenase expression/formation protein HypD
MKYIDEFRNPALVKNLIESISQLVRTDRTYRIMEICGTHTMAIAKYGLRELLPENIELISGPGCPVCVISQGEIDAIFSLLDKEEVVLFTYGDLMKTPGSNGENLLTYKARGSDIRIILSPLDILKDVLATTKECVFVSIGFETTSPASAVLLKEVFARKINNFSIFPFNKVMPGIIDVILNDENLNIDGFLCPGHVAAITGLSIFEPIIYKKRAISVSGFEIIDILLAIKDIIIQLNSENYALSNMYKRVVKDRGNEKARHYLNDVFFVTTSLWRGVGPVEKSGLGLLDDFQKYNVLDKYNVTINPVYDKKGCICGDVLLGRIKPYSCPLFGKDCSPEMPVGPCMVSTEGTCAAYYKYMVKSGYN